LCLERLVSVEVMTLMGRAELALIPEVLWRLALETDSLASS